MFRGIAWLLAGGLLGCQQPSSMSDMMGGDPMDVGGPVDAGREMPDGRMMDAEVEDAEPLRINHLQMRATVNSYHDVNHEGSPELMGYVHLSLDRQAAEQGIRAFDFDFMPDWVSGMFLYPQVSDHPLDDLDHCGDWIGCLWQLRDWMNAHPTAPLVVVLVGEAFLYATNPHFQFQLDDLEYDILSVLGRARILVPADVRGGHETLRDAIRAEGWPTIDATRGKAMFVLNDRALARTFYIDEGGEDPDDPLLFRIGDRDIPDGPLSGDEVVFTFEPELVDHPWLFETDPIHLERIEALAAAGYLVHAISDEPAMIERLRAAGAHFIGTRFPERFGGIPEVGPTVCNPVTAPETCDPRRIEP